MFRFAIALGLALACAGVVHAQESLSDRIARLEANAAQLQALTDNVRAINSNVAALQGKIADLEAGQQRLEAKLDALAKAGGMTLTAQTSTGWGGAAAFQAAAGMQTFAPLTFMGSYGAMSSGGCANGSCASGRSGPIRRLLGR
jgi:peptidoglycan hydrolase CwlO-like protein